MFKSLSDVKFSTPIMPEQTIGERRVRIDFNVTNDSTVYQIKRLSADLINLMDSLKELDPRLSACAMSCYEEGAMWGVKLATTLAVEEVQETVV